MISTQTLSEGSLAGTWQLDPSATMITLRTKAMWGMATVNATLRATEGAGRIGEDGSITGSLSIDAASINTKQSKRDKHLRSKDFFDVEQYPTFTYRVTSATLDADGTTSIVGTFSAHGQTHPLPVRGAVTSADASSVTVSVEAELDRSDWGIDWTKLGARLDTHVAVVAVFARS